LVEGLQINTCFKQVLVYPAKGILETKRGDIFQDLTYHELKRDLALGISKK